MVRLGIVGLGFGARVQLRVLQTIPEVEVTAVVGRGLERAREVASQAGVPIACDHWEALLEMPELTAVLVTTPPATHAEIACGVLASGRHVLCEKPFGANVWDARRMLEAAGRGNRVAAVDFEFRMEPGIERLRSEVLSGTIGEVLRVDVTWLTSSRADPKRPWSWQHDAGQGGGVMGAFASHVLDYLQWICASPIREVSAHTRVLIPYRPVAGEAGLHAVTAEDECDLHCVLASGAVASMRASDSYAEGNGHRIEVLGTRGSLTYTHLPPFAPGQVALVLRRGGAKRSLDIRSLSEPPGIPSRGDAFRRLATLFIDAISGGVVSPDLPSFTDGAQVRAILDAALESARRGTSVLVEM